MANILGTQNNDILNGTVNDDTLYGLEGADSIVSSTGNDVVDGDRIFQSNVAINIPFSSAIGGLLGVTINSSDVMTFSTDTLIGGIGNDTYVINYGGVLDVVVEQANEGIDTVQSFTNYTLGNNLENLTLLDDQLFSVTYTNLQVTMLGTLAPTELDTLYVSTAIQGTGNTLANSIIGNTKSNLLQGLEGDDTLTGGLGNDTLEGGTGTDTAVYMANWSEYRITGTIANATVTGLEGTDSLSNIEYVRFNGVTVSLLDAMNDAPIAVADSNLDDEVVEVGAINAGDNTAIGNILQNDTDSDSLLFADETKKVSKVMGISTNVGVVLQGVYGSIQVFEQGNYIYTLNNDDSDTDALNKGQIAIESFAYSVIDAHGAESTSVLNITIQGSDDISMSPTEGDDIIYGDENEVDYNDYIDALGGNDIVYGLTLDDSLVGGSGNDQLYGDAGNDILDGGTGIDTLVGGVGDDIYLVDDSADVITEVAGEGYDAVISTASYTLSANVEDLTLDGTANINGTGNELNNLIIGNNGNNILDGGAGADAMLGGLGNDTYIVDNVLDGVTENANQGTDTVLSSVSYTLGSNVENLVLQGSANLTGTGNSLNNTITGNVGNNTLNGGIGNDTLIGGAGNDTYYVNGGDTVTELANEGTDRIVSGFSYSLAGVNNVENLSLTGTANINGTGNELNNVITGNSGDNILTGGAGNDTLNGGIGADTLMGGLGNDIYTIDNAGDVIVELANEGTDRIVSGFSYSLAGVNNVENLSLTGTSNINGTGNELNNVITGNSGDNILTGGTGNDILNGGTGNDTYLFNRGNAVDTVTDSDSTVGNKDTIQFGADVASNQLWFSQSGNNLKIQIIGTNDKVVVANWFSGSQYHTEEIKSGDGKILSDANVQNLVNAMASMTPPPVGQTTLTPAEQTALAPVLAANWN